MWGNPDMQKEIKREIIGMKKRFKRNISLLWVISLVIICCSSCNSRINKEDEGSNIQYSEGSNTSVLSNSTYSGNAFQLDDSYSQDGIHIDIHANVDTPEFNSLDQVIYCFDEDNLIHMANEWFIPSYPSAINHSDETYFIGWTDSESSASFIGDAYGYIGYLDGSKDINGISKEDNHMMEYGFITEDVPLGMNIDAKEAGKQAVDFIVAFTPFEYEIYNIITVNDLQKNEGYYEVLLQAKIDGVPVCIVSGGDSEIYYLAFKIRISPNGIFSFQGNVNLKEVEKQPVKNIKSIDEIVNNFKDDIPVLATGTDISVNRIYLAYIPNITYSEESYITLTPSWCFECKESRVEGGQKIDISYTVAYSLDTGRLLGKYN